MCISLALIVTFKSRLIVSCLATDVCPQIYFTQARAQTRLVPVTRMAEI